MTLRPATIGAIAESAAPMELLYSDITLTRTSSVTPADFLNGQVLADVAGGVLVTTVHDDGSGEGPLTYALIQPARRNQMERNRELGHASYVLVQILSRNAVADPQGNNVAFRFIPNTVSAEHYFQQTQTPDGFSSYTLHHIVKPAGYDFERIFIQSQGFPAPAGRVHWNIPAESVVTQANLDSYSIVDVGSSWKWAQATDTSDSASATDFIFKLRFNGTGIWTGDGVSGEDEFMPQLEAGEDASSPIHTPGSASVLRNKDQAEWSAEFVPSWLRAATWAIKLGTLWAHNTSNNDRTIFAFTANDYVMWNGTTKRVEVWAGGVKKVESAALELARTTLLTLTGNNAAGTLKTVGADLGDGTESGTPFVWPSGFALKQGQDSSDNNQAFAWITPPYRPTV